MLKIATKASKNTFKRLSIMAKHHLSKPLVLVSIFVIVLTGVQFVRFSSSYAGSLSFSTQVKEVLNFPQVTSRYKQCVSNRADVCIRKRLKVFCWIFTTMDNLESRSKFIAASWAKHCDGHVFFVCRSEPSLANSNSSVARSLNVVQFNDVNETRRNLYTKTTRALEWMSKEGLFEQYDWFLKADDDTFVIVENFKDLVGRVGVEAKSAYYVGRPLLDCVNRTSFMSGGAGFAMSQGAIKLLHSRYRTECPDVPMPCDCDDLIIGRCFTKWNVSIISSLDSEGKQRFFPMQPDLFFAEKPNQQSNWLVRDAQPIEFGANCCSDSLISFHYVRGHHQTMFYHFAYKVMAKRKSNGNVFSSSLIASCIRYAVDSSVELSTLSTTEGQQQSNIGSMLNAVHGTIDVKLLAHFISIDETYCEDAT